MTDFPWLTTLGVIPLVGAVVIALLPKGAARNVRPVALAFSLLTLVVGILAATQFKAGGGHPQFQLAETHSWIPQFGVSYALGVDGMALALILMSIVLVPIALLAAWNDVPERGRREQTYFALILVVETFMIGVFAATDVFLFYVFFEAMLVPIYFLIGLYGGARRQYAAMKFLLFSLLGGLIMLASLIGLYVVSGEYLSQGTFTWAELQTVAANVPTSTQIWLFLGFFIAFAIKAPLVPFHTWLPDAGAEAPIVAAVLLVGVLDKVGTFGFLRYCLPLFPAASRALAPLVLVLAVIGIIYAALLAVGQTDMSRFVAYTSVAHFGFIAVGIFAFSSQAFAGATLYMVNHGLSTGMLFVMVGVLITRGGSRRIADYGGVAKLAPVLAGCLLLAGMSSLALPGTNSFVSEFLVLIGSFPNRPVFTVIATVGIIFAALYVLWFYQRTMQGPIRGDAVIGALERGGAGGPGAMIDPGVAAKRSGVGFPDLTRREIGVLTPLIVAIVVLGFFPGPLLDVINPSVTATMQEVGLTDPVPVGGLVR